MYLLKKNLGASVPLWLCGSVVKIIYFNLPALDVNMV